MGAYLGSQSNITHWYVLDSISSFCVCVHLCVSKKKKKMARFQKYKGGLQAGKGRE